jgi:peptide/nickel transport system permease protein
MQSAGVLLLVSVLVFALIHLIPGDPIRLLLDDSLSPAVEQQLIRKWGLDQPLYEQYFRWLINIAQGDFGQSIRTQEQISTLIGNRILPTLMLSTAAMMIAIGIGIPAGVIAAYKARTGWDHLAMFVALIGLCIPHFWLALLLMLGFSLHLGWFPVSGYASPFVDPVQALRHLALPGFALGIGLAASISRMTRSAMLDVLGQDYIRTARAKGLSEQAAVFSHALKNAMLPTITVIGLQLGYLLGGAVVIEELFAYPGIGQLLIFAISNRDYPLVQGVVLVFAAVFILINLIVDISYAYFDPRIRYE